MHSLKVLDIKERESFIVEAAGEWVRVRKEDTGQPKAGFSLRHNNNFLSCWAAVMSV